MRMKDIGGRRFPSEVTAFPDTISIKGTWKRNLRHPKLTCYESINHYVPMK